MITRRQTMVLSAAGFLTTQGTSGAQSIDWPSSTVRVVVPFAPAGSVDLLSRFLGEKLGAAMGRPFLIENRPGAGGNLGTELVVRAGADGHTLLVAGSPTHVVNPYLYKNLCYTHK